MPSPRSAGHLNPGDASVVFDRFELGPGGGAGGGPGGALGDLVRHVWVVRWSVPPGEVRPKRVLSYPAVNVVIEARGAVLAGPDPRVSVQELHGEGWAVGVLFRPAAARLLSPLEPAELVGRVVPFAGAPHAAVVAAMHASAGGGARNAAADGYAMDAAADGGAMGVGSGGTGNGAGGAGTRLRLVRVLRGWLEPLAGRVDERGRQANEVGRIAEAENGIVRVDELAQRAGLGQRSLERLVREQIGVTPKWLLECRRLQQAATTLHAHPQTALSALAAELGFADYPHFSRRYARILGETPEATRRAGAASRADAVEKGE